MVVFQIGMALVVLTVAGLLGRSLRELEHLDTGFAPDELTIVELAWPQEKFDTPAKVDALYDRLIPRLEALPDVASASPVNVAPFTGAAAGWDGVFTPQASSGSTEPAVLNLAVVGAGYFRTLGLPVVLGRSITAADSRREPAGRCHQRRCGAAILARSESPRQAGRVGREEAGGLVDRRRPRSGDAVPRDP